MATKKSGPRSSFSKCLRDKLLQLSTLTEGLDIVFRECRNEFRKKQTGKSYIECNLASTSRGNRRKDIRLCDNEATSNACSSFDVSSDVKK